MEELASSIGQAHPSFPKAVFQQQIFDAHWEQRELKDRMRHIAACLHAQLPLPYVEQLHILKTAIWEGEALLLMCFPDFVEQFGLDHPAESLDALEYFTPFASSEFAVRPFFLRHPEATLERFYEWSEHDNHHVRRLSSEGCRPRLPWAMALPAFKKNPSPIFPILERLKGDPSEYVRRSVANNLNDISKDHPERVLQIGHQWLGQTPETNWIVKHALRTLLKKGNTQAMELFGFIDPKRIEIEHLILSKTTVRIGEALPFEVYLHNKTATPAQIRLEYAIDYLKKAGKHSRKVFMLAEREFPTGKTLLQRQQSFEDRTTRKHYPGLHYLTILVNGVEKVSQPFEVTA